LVEGVGPGHRTNFKTIRSNYKKKKELNPREFFDFLDSYAKPSKATGLRRLGMGSRTERNEKDLITMATNTKTITSGDSIEAKQQTRIANAIAEGKFGKPIPEDVAVKIAENLGAFTDPEAQRTVALAIRNGRFGNPIYPKVVENITKKLENLIYIKNQRDVAVAIRVGIFGDPIPPDVAAKIVEKLGAFTDTDAQRAFTRAMKEGKFMGGSTQGSAPFNRHDAPFHPRENYSNQSTGRNSSSQQSQGNTQGNTSSQHSGTEEAKVSFKKHAPEFTQYDDKTKLRIAYIKASLKAHPDKPGGSTKAFQELGKAYEELLKGAPED
jgi:hypothetical protein